MLTREEVKNYTRGHPLSTSTQRGRGAYPKADIVLELSKGGCVKLRTRGEGGGVKKPEKFVDVLNGRPLIRYS